MIHDSITRLVKKNGSITVANNTELVRSILLHLNVNGMHTQIKANKVMYVKGATIIIDNFKRVLESILMKKAQQF